MRTVAAFVVVATIGLGHGALAQHAGDHRLPAIPASLLERPIAIRQDIGLARDPLVVLPADAQRFYDQGLAYLHNYVWIDAVRAFRQSLRSGTDTAMPHVGLSYAFGAMNMRTAARDALAAARRLAADEHETRHVAVRDLEIRAEDAPGDRAAWLGYRSALDDAVGAFPEDQEFLLLRGMAEAPAAGERGQNSPPTAVPFYERATRLAPGQLAAPHYLAHAYESGGDMPLAMVYGERYARLAPGIPHAHHMFAHSLRRAGRTREAIAELETADRLQREYFSREEVAPETDWHYEHNLDLLGTSYQYIGQLRRAAEFLRRGFELPTANLVQAVNKRQWPLMLRLAGRMDEALAAGTWLQGYPHPVARAVGHIEAAHVLMVRGGMERAAAEANAAVAALKSADGGQGLAHVPLLALQGEFLLRQGQRARGERLLGDALAQARAGRGPDEWAQALFMMESIASAARAAGAWPLARTVADAMAQHDAAYGGTHLALALAAEHEGAHDVARREYATAKQLWRDADAGFPPLATIDAALARLR